MMTDALQQALRTGETEASDGAFDAIVVGAGAAGGLAAEQLCLGGARVLLLDAAYTPSVWRAPWRRTTGALIKWSADPRLLTVLPPRIVNAGRRALRIAGRLRQPVQTECFAWERLPEAFVDDRDFPFVTPAGQPFAWIRAHAAGGRMIIPGHGRQYYRLGEEDLAPPDGLSAPWPVPGGELAHWYEQVERKLNLFGRREGLSSPPDSIIAHEFQMRPSDETIAREIRRRWPDAEVMASRYAPPLDTLSPAAATGRLVYRAGACVQRVLSKSSNRVDGVEWNDLKTGRLERASAPIVFLCASSLESTRILLMSKTATGEPLGEASAALGRYLMDHMMVKAEGVGPALGPETSPADDGHCLYLPRFDRRVAGKNSGRGFGVQLYNSAAGSRSYFTAAAFAEVAPRADNRVTLDSVRKDVLGNPALRIDFALTPDELAQAKDISEALKDLAGIANARLFRLDDKPDVPGTAVHECGTARMGVDPSSSVLDPDNQCWDAQGLYVTDGASFPSQGSQNPTLTIMALTMRACAHALGTSATGAREPA
jgi:choline dehydrogenase-like flavoprotein